MTPNLRSERGSAMVFAVGVLAVLAILALIIVSVVVTEKRTAAADYSSERAFYSADAASEAGVNWLRGQLTPPPSLDSLSNVRLSPGAVALTADHSYEFDVRFVTKQFRPGWSVEYKDFVYRVEASGASAQQSQAALEINTTRLFREGY